MLEEERLITYETEGRVAVVSLDRPEARKAKEMLFTGELIDDQEAWRLGKVNHVVPSAKLDKFILDTEEKT